MSYIKRWSLLMVVLACVAPSAGSSATSRAILSGDRTASGLPPEVRLRKMHLVRPDLIPYPIEIEVYC